MSTFSVKNAVTYNSHKGCINKALRLPTLQSSQEWEALAAAGSGIPVFVVIPLLSTVPGTEQELGKYG